MLKTIPRIYFFLLFCLLAASACKKPTQEEVYDFPPPSAEEKATWLERMNHDVLSLKTIVNAMMGDNEVTTISIDSSHYTFRFESLPDVSFTLDNANYPAPLIGAHEIDDAYYWTRINGTGTSATVLLKDANRSNYEITEDGVLPQFDINEKGAWVIHVEDHTQSLYDGEGKPFRAIGVKALFSEVSFDLDSNATIRTNEVPARSYTLRKHRPFTLLLSLPSEDTLKVASGFALPIDFQFAGLESLSFKTPEAWSASYVLNEEDRKGVITILAPTGLEENFDEKGMIEITARNAQGNTLVRKIPVRCEVGLVNYASVRFTDAAGDLEITGANFAFAESISAEETKDVTAVKAGEAFRLLLPDGYPELRSVRFTTTSGEFDYYFAPGTSLAIGEQEVSIIPPEVLSFWQGGIILKINETLPLNGIARYKITGKLLNLQIGPKVPWFPNGNVDVSTANSATDGATNTQEIIKALGGAGSSANYIARWPIRLTDGGYKDWYLGAVSDYELFHAIRWADKQRFMDQVERYGGEPLDESVHTIFWTSTNINQTQARVYDHRKEAYITAGTKVYGCYGLAFRDIE